MAAVGISNGSHNDGAGSLGALVRERGGSGRIFAVTAAHVLATHPDTALNDGVDIECEQAGAATNVTARLCAWQPHFDGSPAGGLDVALSTLTHAAYLQLAAVPGLLPSGVAQPNVGAAVELQSSARGPVNGQLLGYVSCWMRSGQSFEHRYFLDDALCYELDGGSQHGDSGAPVWDATGRLVAIHVGATPPGTLGNSLGIPIQRVLDHWAVDLVSGAAPALPLPLQPAQPLLATTHRVVATTGEAAPTTTAAESGDDRGVLVRTVWGEARGEPREGMAGVAHVVLNRVRAQRYWGRTISAVCLKPYQFSCWNADDPNRTKLLQLAVDDTRAQEVREVVDAVIGNRLGDPTDGATHYHNRWMARPPRWVQGRAPCRLIGNHAFYKNID
ncbi:MAG TPA: cell wall hydrolase [Roseateles sp.]